MKFMSYRKTITAQIFGILCGLEYMVYIVHYELGSPLMAYEALNSFFLLIVCWNKSRVQCHLQCDTHNYINT